MRRLIEVARARGRNIKQLLQYDISLPLTWTISLLLEGGKTGWI